MAAVSTPFAAETASGFFQKVLATVETFFQRVDAAAGAAQMAEDGHNPTLKELKQLGLFDK